MSGNHIRSRLLKLEQRILPAHDGFTLEELCRAMWQRDEQQFFEIAKGSSVSFFVPQFEFEDLERERRNNQPGRNV